MKERFVKHLNSDIGEVELMRANRRDLYVVDMKMTEVKTCLLLKKTFSTSQCVYLQESRQPDLEYKVDLSLEGFDVKSMVNTTEP
jgi:hypothetical protein